MSKNARHLQIELALLGHLMQFEIQLASRFDSSRRLSLPLDFLTTKCSFTNSMIYIFSTVP